MQPAQYVLSLSRTPKMRLFFISLIPLSGSLIDATLSFLLPTSNKYFEQFPRAMMELSRPRRQNAAVTTNSMEWVESILSQLSLDEKISLMSGKSMWTLRDIERVGLPSVRVSDGPQGVRKTITDLTAIESFPATCFPPACAMACSWNRNLIESVGKALSKECRDQGVNILLGPGMNIKRHPRGGRNFEYFSEDPVLSGHMAAAMVKGIQSSGHVGACIKHVCVNNQESWRFRVDALVDERTLREIYLKGFHYVIENASPWTLMCAYNQLNGHYCSEHRWLFQEIIRGEWNYQGHIMTDWGATNRRAVGIEAGIDLEMPGTFGIHNTLIKSALKDGTLSQARFDEAVRRNIQLVHRAVTATSTADETGDNELPESKVLSQRNHELAYQAALDCIVLLKNDNILPLSSWASTNKEVASTPASVALIGEFCKDPRFQGMGSSKVNAVKIDTVLDNISNYTDQYVYSPGYRNDDIEDDVGPTYDPLQTEIIDARIKLIRDAVDVAKQAEIVIVMAGVPEIHESEGFDREHLDLPAQHNMLIESICEVNPNVVVVLSNGGPVILPLWKDKVKAIVDGYLLGQASGRAILDILFGVASPSGKLAETFPLSMQDVPSNKYFPGNSHTVEYREGLNIGYRYYDTAKVPVLYPFGHGLSYTNFSYTECDCNVASSPTEANRNTVLQVYCKITNTGELPGAEIVQVYLHCNNEQTEHAVYHPEHQLQDFHKTKVLHPGESECVYFNLSADAFAFFDVGKSDWILEEDARYEVRIAASSRDIRWTGEVNSAAIANSASCNIKIAKPSREAFETHPAMHAVAGNRKGCVAHPLVVSDDAFRAMLGRDPVELMTLSTRTLLGDSSDGVPLELSTRSVSSSSSQNDDQQQPLLLPQEIPLIHRNSLLEEIERNGCFGNLFVRIIVKTMETEMGDPNNKRQQKMIREVARNLPLRCLATFSRGSLSFEVLDSLIATFNGHYCSALGHLTIGAKTSWCGSHH